MRLAIVSPLPPAATGIADYTIDVTRALLSRHTIDLFHDQESVSDDLPAPAYPIGQLQSRAAASPYDAVVYQMGNGPAHDFMYDVMPRVPGAVVLHDLVLHHSYARRYLESAAAMDYMRNPSDRRLRERAEANQSEYVAGIDAAYGGLGQRLKDACLNSTGDLLPYAFPLFEPALLHATSVGAHNSYMVDAIGEAFPGLSCVQLTMPVRAAAVDPDRILDLRGRLGLEPATPVVGCFGLVTREKRIETVARAVSRLSAFHPRLRLLLAGPVSERAWLEALLHRTGVAARTIVAGRLDAPDFVAAMSLTTAVAHLRYPTARETSAALLRLLAQARPVVIPDLANQSEIPGDVVKRVEPCDEEGDVARSLDWILRNPDEAQAMGGRAAAYVASHHTEQKTRDSYEALLNHQAPLYPQPSP